MNRKGWTLAALLTLLLGIACRTRLPPPPPEPAPEPPAPVQVTSEPAGAAVLLDGQAVGKAPLETEAMPGSHTLCLSLEGYEPHHAPLEVLPKKGADVAITLTARPATWMVRSDPPGAAVFLDGQKKGTTPLDLRPVAVGKHRIQVTLDGYEAYEGEGTVNPGSAAETHVSLRTDPRRAALLQRVAQVEVMFGQKQFYRAWRDLEGLRISPDQEALLGSEMTRRLNSLREGALAGIPRVSFEIEFAGSDQIFSDALGPPVAMQAVATEDGAGFVDFTARIRSEAPDPCSVCLLQFKRKKGTASRVIPHEIEEEGPSVVLAMGPDGEAVYSRGYAARSGDDDILYCLIVSPEVVTAEGIQRARSAGLDAEREQEDGILWAADVIRRIENTPDLQNGRAVLRSLLVRMEGG